jgi:N-methylhydantoinase A
MLEHDFESSVGCWITSTAHALRRALTVELAKESITLRQWEVLASIAFDEDPSQVEIADRLGIDTVIVPPGAGVGSAIGFLRAPVSYEVVRTVHQRLDRFDYERVNDAIVELRHEARLIVDAAAPDADTVETIHASMRYRGQGHEIDVVVPIDGFGPGDDQRLLEAFDQAYRSLYTRVIPGMVAEVLTWRLKIATVVPAPAPVATPTDRTRPAPDHHRALDVELGWLDFGLHRRIELVPGDHVSGPALIIEDQTTTVVGPAFDVRVDGRGHLVLTRRRSTTDMKGAS